MAILINLIVVSVISEKAALCADATKLWEGNVKRFRLLLQKSPAHTPMYFGIPAIES